MMTNPYCDETLQLRGHTAKREITRSVKPFYPHKTRKEVHKQVHRTCDKKFIKHPSAQEIMC